VPCAFEHLGEEPAVDLLLSHVLAALERNNGNRTLTAEQLEIGPATLFRKLKRYGDGPWSLLLVAEAWARVVEFITSI
jgi:Bacterial regulatory protein, Fis family